MTTKRELQQLNALKNLATELGEKIDINASVALWDGQKVPLGKNVTSDLTIRISSPGVVASLVRRPTLDRLVRHYAHGQIGFDGGTLIELGEQLGDNQTRKRLRKVKKSSLIKALWPFLFAPGERPQQTRAYSGDEMGSSRQSEENRDFIEFHYDVGNDFYRLFLDPYMQYSCAYYTNWDNTLEQAQEDKLEMICRKLRLKPGDHLLDIGCGWGGLVCYAAKNFGVTAHGVTLSPSQLEVAQQRIASNDLEDRVSVEIKNYEDLTGSFSKIASVGMYEHIGITNIPKYFRTVRNLLTDDGLFLNHAISRRAKKHNKSFASRPEQRVLQRYIFPGGELDDIGHSVRAMEQAGFEVHDVEAWREHYARTTKLWYERLEANREAAIKLVGAQTYRIWLAYLGGCSLAFARGSARIYQTLASRSAKGASPLPPTRSDLYA